MLYIQKGEEPLAQQTTRIKIQRSTEWKATASHDTATIRDYFNQLPKQEIRDSLVIEQKGLCAYCMRRLDSKGSHMNIEHWVPLSKNKDLALSYSNMLGVCDGGKKSNSNSRKKVLCCDASKDDDATMTINPLDEEQMKEIAYLSDGTIYTMSNDAALQRDIDDILKLNGELDCKTGKRIADTATCLVKNRKDAYERCKNWIRGLDKKHKCTSAVIGKRIEEICNSYPMEEYAGVTLFLLRKKKRQLEERGL